MNKLKVVLHAFFEAIKASLETFILPTGGYLLPALAVSAIILLVTIICKIFHLFTLLDIPGAALGVLILLGITFIERKERDDISKVYRAVATRVQAITVRQTHTATDESAEVDASGTELCAGGSESPESGSASGEHREPAEGDGSTSAGSTNEVENSSDTVPGAEGIEIQEQRGPEVEGLPDAGSEH